MGPRADAPRLFSRVIGDPRLGGIAIGALGALSAALVGPALLRYGASKVGMGLIVLGLLLLAFRRIEILYVLLYAVGFIAPAVMGNGVWPPVITLFVVGIILRELIVGRGGAIIPSFLLFYGAIYVLCTIHGSWNPASFSALRAFLTPPLIAMVTATVAQNPRIRRNLILLMAPFIALQIPVALLQALHGIHTFGRYDFTDFGDAVTGTFGGSASGTLALTTVGFATVLFAASLEGVWKPRILLAASLVLSCAGVVAIARAVFIFVPVAFGVVLLTGGFLARGSISLRRLLALAIVLVVATPAVVITMTALYPGVVNDINTVEKVRNYLFLPNSGPNGERGAQLEGAIHDMRTGGIDSVLLGHGVGTTWGTADPHVAVGADNSLVVRSAQADGSVWIPRILVETGLAGAAAFIAFVLYLGRMGVLARRKARSGTLDAALGLAMPGLAALTFVGAFYQTVLDVPPYATLLWVLLGLGIAVARGPASEPARSEVRAPGAGRLVPAGADG
jgi:hypothetical protein